MAVALVLCASQLPSDSGATGRAKVRILDPIRALRHTGLLGTSIGSALYTAAFFAVLAWAPFVLQEGAAQIGLLFFGWGVSVAVAGVFLAPKVAARLGERRAIVLAVLGYAVLMAVMAVGDKVVVMVAVVLSGVVSGLLNTLFTGTAMSISPAPRPVASAGYNFCRWLGGAAAATLVGPAADLLGGVQTPFAVAAVACVLAAVLLAVVRHGEDDPRQLPAEAPLVGEQL